MAANFGNSENLYLRKNKQLSDEIVRQKAIKVGFVFFGTICIVGFIICLGLLIEGLIFSNASSGVVGLDLGYLWGFVILIFISLSGSVIAILWLKFTEKESYK